MTVSEQIKDVLNALFEKFGIAIDWTADNVLPYVQELCEKFVVYEISTSVFLILFMTVLSTACFAVGKKTYKTMKIDEEKHLYSSEWWGVNLFVWVVFIIVATTSIFTISTQIHDIITCVTFPEMMLVEKIQSLMSQT